jgi:hypothetical protein
LGPQHLREHRDNALQQLDASVVPVEPDQHPQLENIQRRRALHLAHGCVRLQLDGQRSPDQVHAAVAVKVHDHDQVNVNDGCLVEGSPNVRASSKLP